MTSFRNALTILSILGAAKVALAEGEEHGCTRGKLFISEQDTATLHVVDLNAGWDKLSVTKLDLALKGKAPLYLDQAADSLIVTATFWGSDEAFNADGYMNLVHTGVGLEDHGDHSDVVDGDPYLINNVDISCGPAYHPVSSHGFLSVACDGNAYAGINSTIMIYDEAKLSGDADAESPLLATYTLPGSHHGIAIPLGENRVMHSLPTAARLADPEADSLPNTFQIVDYEGNVVSTLSDEEDPNKSCFGYHGVSHVANEFVFACSSNIDEHGGVLVFTYDETTDATTSRALMYPDTDLEDHRSGGIVGHSKSDVVIADFASWDETYAPQLLSINPDATEISPENLLILGDLGMCDYDLEKANGEFVVVLLPSGMVRVYKAVPEWKFLAEKQIYIPANTTACPWPGPFKVGYMSAFAYEGETLMALDLSHVEDEGEIVMYEVELGFTPYSLNVAGVPEGKACGSHDHHDDDHDPAPSDNNSGARRSGLSVAGALLFSLMYMML